MAEHYKILSLLGEGAYGKCYLVETTSKHEKRVIKQIDLNPLGKEAQNESLREAKILEQLDHPNIIKFHEVYKTKRKKLCIVMDFADGGDLAARLKSQSGVPLNENLILDYFVQICLALKHVHDRKILHRDLKAQNIFLMKSGIVKLGDFGIAKVLNSTRENAKSMVGTPYYLSPEIVQNLPYSFKSDIWSLGVLLYEMCALRPPFEASSIHGLAMKIVSGKYNPIPSHYSTGLKSLITALLTHNPAQRPPIHEILWMPIVQRHIHNFLEESLAKQEFSHTVLHGFKILDQHSSVPIQRTNTESSQPDEQTSVSGESTSVTSEHLEAAAVVSTRGEETTEKPAVVSAEEQAPPVETIGECSPAPKPREAQQIEPASFVVGHGDASTIIAPAVDASLNNEQFLAEYSEAKTRDEKRRVMLEDIKEKKLRHSMKSIEYATASDIHLQGLETQEEILEAKAMFGEVAETLESQARILEMQEALLEHPTEAVVVEMNAVEAVVPDREDDLPESLETTPVTGSSSDELLHTSGLGKMEAMFAYLEEQMGESFFPAYNIVREMVDQKTEDEIPIDLIFQQLYPIIGEDNLEERVAQMLVLIELDKEANG